MPSSFFAPAIMRILFVFLISVCAAPIFAQSSPAELLRKADDVRSADPKEFSQLLTQAQLQKLQFSASDQELFDYLMAWKTAYSGRSNEAVQMFERSANFAKDPNIVLRARASLMNVLLIAKRPEEAFTQMPQMTELLSKASDPHALDQGLMTAAMAHVLVAQYDSGLNYADRVLETSQSQKTLCKAGQIKIDALYRTKQLSPADEFVSQVLKRCVDEHEAIFANLIRITLARSMMDSGDPESAKELLSKFRDEALATRYPRLISDYEAAIAQAHLQLNQFAEAREAANFAIRESTKDEFSEPLVNAYRVLYQVASQLQDLGEALRFHELYAAADKGYLNEISARQMAFQLVLQQTQAAQAEIESLNKQNKLLQLQDQLTGKAVETFRLYLALLLLSMGFIAFWAYKTKRLQMYFMTLSRSDSLTGLINRPYLIECATQLLDRAHKQNAQVCLMIMDLDHFKQVNDQYGHAAGDVVLKNAVQAVLPHLGPKDIFGRLGGEEFGIVLPGISDEAALARAECFRHSVEEVRSPVNGKSLQVTASFGVASTHDSGYEWRELVTRADLALYRAKSEGRNCVVHVSAPLTSGQENPPKLSECSEVESSPLGTS